jgi:hypothetical protein
VIIHFHMHTHTYLLHTYAHAYTYIYVHAYIHVRVCHASLTAYACCRGPCEIEAGFAEKWVGGEGLRDNVPGNSLAVHVLAEPRRTRAALWPATVQSCWQPSCSLSAGNRAVAAASMLMPHAMLELWHEMIETGMFLCAQQRPLTPLPKVPCAITFQYVFWNFAAQGHAPRPPPFHAARSGILPGTQSVYPCSAVRCRRPPADRCIASEDEEAGQHGDAAGQGPLCHGRIAVQKKKLKTEPDHGAHRAHGSLHAGDCGARGYVKGWGEDATGTKDRLSSSFRRHARWDTPTPRPHLQGIVSSKRLGRAALKPRPVWSARPSAIRSL